MKRKTIITLFLVAVAALTASADSVLNLKKSLEDPNLVYPNSYETDVDAMMKGWWENGYIDMEKRHAGKVIDASDEVIAERLAKMPTVIEMPYNQVVGQFIRMYVNKRRQLVENMLGMSLYYMPIFERALESRGMPLELKYLPIIESALNPVAVSPAGAAGLWQFMPATGRGVGLEISSLVDERLDPIKSSEKAADYLKSLYNTFHDWSLAIAAYNCGPGNVNKALRRAGGRNNDFWTIYPYLPKETRGYVPAFIAANYVMTYYNQHGISPALAKRPLITDTIHVANRVHFAQIAEVLDIPVSEIKILNPQYRRGEIPGDIKPYALTLPSKQCLAYIMFEDSILNHRAEDFARRMYVDPGSNSRQSAGNGDDNEYIYETTTKQVTHYHTVHKKETLGSIAKKYHVSTGDIKRWNGIGGKVKRGQHLKIITTKKVTTKRLKPKTDNNGASSTEPEEGEIGNDSGAVPPPPARVSKSDNGLNENISGDVPAPHGRKATTTPSDVPEKAAKPNGYNSHRQDEVPSPSREKAKSTEKVKEKKETEKAKTSAKPIEHVVKSGDRVANLAKKYGVSEEAIRKANNLDKNSKIIVGHTLKIPAKNSKGSSKDSKSSKSKDSKSSKSKDSKSSKSKDSKSSKSKDSKSSKSKDSKSSKSKDSKSSKSKDSKSSKKNKKK